MKRCPTCNRTFTDPNLSYCVDDGTPLTTEVDDESTVVSPSSTGARDDWADVPYRPPTFQAPSPPPKKRRAWPWVVGIAGAFILGVVGLMIAAAIFLPRMVRERQSEARREAGPVASPTTVTTTETEQTENVDAPAPTDEEQVLAQLRDLENEWTVANLNADKKKLARILADDYVGPVGEGGPLQGKTEYINSVERDTRIERWEFDELKVRLAGDRATLTGKVTFVVRGREAEFDFIDKFVWRNGRWQATGAEIKRRQ